MLILLYLENIEFVFSFSVCYRMLENETDFKNDIECTVNAILRQCMLDYAYS